MNDCLDINPPSLYRWLKDYSRDWIGGTKVAASLVKDLDFTV
jgi:hypothetical protein